MGMMNLQQALDWIRSAIPQARLVGDGATLLARVHTDTRTLQAGDLFVALKGERFDANAFLADAQAGGAVAAIAPFASPPIEPTARSLSVIGDYAPFGMTLSYSEGLAGSPSQDDFSAACMPLAMATICA